MPTTTLMGKLLNKVREARWVARSKAQTDLWKRNKLDNPAKREGYRIEEIKSTTRDGNEHFTYQLWKMIDEEKVSIDTEVITQIVKDSDDWGMS